MSDRARRRTVLARMMKEAPSQLAIDGEEERILALLSAGFDKSVPVEVIGNMRRASEQWSRGERCLAHIHLAFAGLPQIGEDGATRLALADEALAKGVTPSETFVTREGLTITRADDGTQLRINTDGTVRIERPITIGRKRREVIHFNPD